MLLYREATTEDIEQMHAVRLAVKENILSNPSLVTHADYEQHLTRKGKGWVCIAKEAVAGFAIVDAQESNVWALFVHPSYEGRGVGKELHDRMLTWYFQQSLHPLHLTTAPGTRAERFYEHRGWRATGVVNSGEIRFEMNADEFKSGMKR